MQFIALSTAVTDRIQLADGTRLEPLPGGAGIYALAGMRIWADDVGIVTGVGADYLDHYGEWYGLNGITTAGLIEKDAHTPVTEVVYDADGERNETPVYGRAHYHAVEATPEDLEQFCQNAQGVYIFRNNDPSFWERIFRLKARYGFQIVWEVAANAATLDFSEQTLAIAKRVDMLSINRTESMRLMRVDTFDAVLAEFRLWQRPLVYLRNGADGCYVIREGRVCHVPSVENATAVDVTGGGNSSTGGAFIGFCKGFRLEKIGAMGNVSASFCIAQHGVPRLLDAGMRAEAKKRMDHILERMERAGDEK